MLFEEKYSGREGRRSLQELEIELNRAKIVPSSEVEADVITINSTVELFDIENQEEMKLTLVFPKQADMSQGRISLLSPIGMAMLGYKEGDIFEWDTPGGKRAIRVEKVITQPEALGDDQ